MDTLQWALGLTCHQDPERCFWLGGMPMLVCARCFGVYLGLLLGMVTPWPRRVRDVVARWSVLGVVIAANFTTWLISPLDTNSWRFVLGLCFGIACSAWSEFGESLSRTVREWWRTA